MFSVCLFTGGGAPTGGAPPGVPPPNWGVPRGYPPKWGAPPGVPPNWLGAPGGTPPPPKFGQKCWTKFGTKNGQRFGQKMDKKLDKHFGNFWSWGARAVRLLRSRRRTVLYINTIRQTDGRLDGQTDTDNRPTAPHNSATTNNAVRRWLLWRTSAHVSMLIITPVAMETDLQCEGNWFD